MALRPDSGKGKNRIQRKNGIKKKEIHELAESRTKLNGKSREIRSERGRGKTCGECDFE